MKLGTVNEVSQNKYYSFGGVGFTCRRTIYTDNLRLATYHPCAVSCAHWATRDH
uniref:Uncharacterized protein n=1 Tax=Kalanchoe fedtschenkoi TaxID=63787 RepID=A0A7N0T822_KALFE